MYTSSHGLHVPATGLLIGEVRPDLLRDELLPEIFSATAARAPAKTAIVAAGRQVSYAELEARANRVAHGLQARGIGPGSLVGLWMTRSLDLHVALLGILKSGAAYVPFDAKAPPERVAESLADCSGRFLVIDGVTGVQAGDIPVTRLLLADLDQEATPATAPDLRALGMTPDDTAYAIYTSGSTGKPKGIAVSHRNICHYLRSANTVYGLTADDIVFQGASVAFDLSLEEIWIPYLAGATLWLASPDIMNDTERLPGVLEAAGVTVIDTVPALLSMLDRDVSSLRLIILGGEACPPEVAARWCRPGRRVFNSYGPTEATVVATVAEVRPGEPVTIGGPIPNYVLYVVDEELRPVPPGTAGELLIGGPGVARGYINRDSLTAQRFIANPFQDDCGAPLLFRSGDAVSVTEQGQLAFHGRIDDQVKIRGYRVELGEIETRLAAMPDVAQAAVVLRRDDEVDRLVAFLVPRPGACLDAAALRARLAACLPPYMVPSLFEMLDALPRLASGKVDRNTLRTAPLKAKADCQESVPSTPAEASLLAAAKKVFPGQTISLDADFFLDLGGHSLLAARFVSTVRETPALAGLTLHDVYSARTLRLMAACIEARMLTSGPASRADLSFTPPPLLRRFLCGLAQAAVMPVVLGLFTAPWLGVFISYMLLSGDDASFTTELVTLLSAYSLINAASMVLAIAGKWLVIGRTKPGRYPLWGVYYFRWWLAQRFIGLVHGKWLQGTPLMRVFLRSLGATVGGDSILGDIEAGAIDLVTIGSGVSISDKVRIGNAEVVGDELIIGPVSIGDDVFIGNSAVIGHDVTIGRSAGIEDLTAIPAGTKVGDGEHWDGSPGRCVGKVDLEGLPEHAEATPARKAMATAVYVLALFLLPPVSMLPIFPAFYLFDHLGDVINAKLGLDYLQVLPLLAWPAAMALVVATVGFIVALRWLILPRVRSGTYSVHSGFYIRKWLVALATELTLETLTSMFATVYMRAWYRLMGATIGKDAEISTNLAGRYDLTEIGEKCFIADEVVLGEEEIRRGWMTLKPVRTAARVFIGNDAVVPPGADIPTGTLIGIKSKPPTEEAIAPGDTWFGSPPIRLPVRQRFDDVAACWTFEPSWRRRLARAVFEAFTVSMPTMLSITLGTLAVELLTPSITEEDYATATLLFLALSVAVAVALTLVSVVLKWVMMGVYKPIAKPMWSWWAMRTEAVAVVYWGMAGKALLEHLRGTPMLPWILRLFGAKFGQGVFMDSTDITEFDCVKVGDFCAINAWSALQTHLYEDRVMKVGRVNVGNGVTVGALATVLYDTTVGDFAHLRPLTLVMKGEFIPAHSDWSGAPAVPTTACGCLPQPAEEPAEALSPALPATVAAA